jgi:hypothetical protein
LVRELVTLAVANYYSASSRKLQAGYGFVMIAKRNRS